MKRYEVDRILRHMEHVRECSYEAETKSEEKRLVAQYSRMWRAIEPYVSGKVPYSD